MSSFPLPTFPRSAKDYKYVKMSPVQRSWHLGSAAPKIVVNAVTTIKQAANANHGPGSDEPSIGVGNFLSSNIISFLLIPTGCCALAVHDDMTLLRKRRLLLRDVGTYALSLWLLCIFFHDGVIQQYEAATSVSVHVG